MAMQSLGNSMTAAGGIGIAKMIAKQLHKAADVAGSGCSRDPPAVTPNSQLKHATQLFSKLRRTG